MTPLTVCTYLSYSVLINNQYLFQVHGNYFCWMHLMLITFRSSKTDLVCLVNDEHVCIQVV